MDGVTIGFISIGVISLTNLVLVAFHGGKISQKVDDQGARITQIEKKCFQDSSKSCQ